jgi:hypothetical protein
MLPPPEGGPLPPQISPLILFPWLGAHLALGYLGYLANYNNTTKTFDAAYDEFKAYYADRDAFDKEIITDELLDED